jgi:putative SOS response-associated peptidase YedK
MMILHRLGCQPINLRTVAAMCNLYRMEDKDWVNKWAQNVESMINLMPAYQMNPNEWGPILRNTADGRKQLVHARWGLPAPRWVDYAEAPLGSAHGNVPFASGRSC